jgi:ubiquinone/menaquinone biosynthesis C-methylase UbiE
MMSENNQPAPKSIGTREWYDFIGHLANILPGLHLGGRVATHELLQICQIDSASRVLDIGCGSGNTACMVAQQYGAQVVGVDLSEVMIVQARKRAYREGMMEKVEFRVADVYQLPFEDGTFDVVLAESALTPLLGDKHQAMKEIVRVLCPGGRVGVNESTFDQSISENLLVLMDEHPAIHGHFSPETLRGLFEQANLQITHISVRKSAEAPSALKEMGIGGLLSFMVRTYPKILLKLLRDARFRKASKIDDQLTKQGKPYMGYTLIVGRKPV